MIHMSKSLKSFLYSHRKNPSEEVMSMSDVVSVRLNKEDMAFVGQISQKTKVPAETYMKQLLHQAVARAKKQRAVHAYAKGRLTLREAASVAGVPPREMMDLLTDAGVRKFGDLKVRLDNQLEALQE